ncbi:MAG TPA: GNAT family N-acetyltransferase [Ferruginibacter sp.]|nr:GNAT family N-acetyltransferase [Ferruginibacter sp.]
MNIQHELPGKKGTFFIEIDGKRLAEMVYNMANPELMIIEHTEVDDALRGKNVGYQLVHAAVDFARANNIRIIPLCPFAKSVFDKKMDEFGDVLKK